MKTVTPMNLVTAIASVEPSPKGKPLPHLVAELRQFASAFSTESVRFTARGLREEFLRTASVLADELERRESAWTGGRFVTPEEKALWKKLSEIGYDCRDRLLDDLDLALMDNSDAQRTLAAIREGDSAEDMILDISKLVELARRYFTEVAASGVTEKQLTDAAILGKQVADAFAATIGSGQSSKTLKLERDKARTFAADYSALVRRYADTIYRDEPEKRALFVSAYDKAKNKKYHSKTSDTEAPKDNAES